MFKRLLVVAVISAAALHWWTGRPVVHGPGQVAPDAPVQELLADASVFRFNDYTITPLATFEMRARVLSREDYYLGREAELSPVDLAVGWGPMSDESVLDNIDISQSGRFFHWRVNEFPIPRQAIETHSANMHFVPADDVVSRYLKRVRTGQVVSVKGYLVRIEADDNWHWQSSLRRDDTGNGACELIWVRHLDIQT